MSVEFEKTKVGICFGGYCPMHRGHLDAIMRAKKENDVCLVVVCGYDGEPRAAELGLTLHQRYQLVKEFFKGDEQVEVMCVNDTELGIDESMSDSNWRVWFDCVQEHFTAPSRSLDEYDFIVYGWSPKFYVAEPFYADAIKRTLGADVCLLPKEVPVTGTLVRKDPLKYWDYIVPTFRPYLSRNILVCGTASEGKTTLVKDIHRYFGLPYTEEFGRIYMAEKNMCDTDLTARDFREFMIGQRNYIRQAESYPGNRGVTIHDTDNLVTLMYAAAYAADDNIDLSPEDYESLAALAWSLRWDTRWEKIFLLKPHAKFVDDGTRYMEQSSIEEREKNYAKLVELLKLFGYWDKVTILDGTYYENYVAVRDYVGSLMYAGD